MVSCDLSVEKGSTRSYSFTIKVDGEALDFNELGNVDRVFFDVRRELNTDEDALLEKQADSLNSSGVAVFNIDEFDLESGLYRYRVIVDFTDGRRYVARLGRFEVKEV